MTQQQLDEIAKRAKAALVAEVDRLDGIIARHRCDLGGQIETLTAERDAAVAKAAESAALLAEAISRAEESDRVATKRMMQLGNAEHQAMDLAERLAQAEDQLGAAKNTAYLATAGKVELLADEARAKGFWHEHATLQALLAWCRSMVTRPPPA